MAIIHDDVSARIADFVLTSRPDDLPSRVRGKALRSMLNGFGTALGGSSDEATRRLLATLRPFGGPPRATVIGHAGAVDGPLAAFLNAVAVNVFDFDDTHEGTIIHPTAPVMPALLALSELEAVSGSDLLHAFALGVEVACRIGNSVSPSHYRRGWHITATCGVFGAACAVGRLIGLDRRQMVWALGAASAQACGMVETLGTMAKSVGVGNAARNGLLSALMAKNGVEGPAAPLEGPRGFLALTSDAADPNLLIDQLGETWELDRNMWKPYPCGVVLNPVIDACLEARRDPRFSAEEVVGVTAAGHPLLRERADRPSVTTGRESQVSAQHAIAVSLLRGTAGVADFSDQAVGDPEVLAMRARVRPVEVDTTLPVEAASLSVEMRDGARIELRVDVASGSVAKPLSDDQLERKFRELSAYGCPGLDPQPLLDALWHLDQMDDAAQIMRLAGPN